MQIFGLRLGETSNPSQKFSLEELKLQLGQELNQKSPLLAQMFVHIKPAKRGHSWLMSESSQTPKSLAVVKGPESTCSIVFQAHGNVVYHGKMSAFAALVEYWNRASTAPGREGIFPAQRIHLDATITELANIDPSFMALNLPLDVRQHELARLLTSTSKLNLSAILLGRFQKAERGLIRDFWMALIIQPQIENSEAAWMRLGLCTWEAPIMSLKALYEEIWTNNECLLV